MGIFNFRKQTIEQPKERSLDDIRNDLMDSINLRGIDTPKAIISSNNDYVFVGPNNQFPIELIDLKNNSAIHDAIIEGKTNLIAGNGIIFDKTREISETWLIENSKLVPFYPKLDKVFWLVTRDQLTFGYSCFEVIYSMDKTRIVDLNWIDASRLAWSKSGECYYWCKDWKNTNQNKPIKYDKFNANDIKGPQLMVIKTDENNMDYFCLPNYYSALKWIKSDVLMAEYTMSAIKNGFSPSIIFKFYKKPTQEERRYNNEMINKGNGGPTNAGKALLFYSDGKDLATDVQVLDATNIDARLLQSNEQIIQEIVSAHRSHPSLCGIAIPGKLGYSNDLLQAWSIMNAMVIKPERKLILDSFKQVLIHNGVIRMNVEEIDPIEIIEQDIEKTI